MYCNFKQQFGTIDTYGSSHMGRASAIVASFVYAHLMLLGYKAVRIHTTNSVMHALIK